MKKVLSIILCLVMVVSVVAILPYTARAKDIDIAQTGKTADEAIAWVQSQVGQSIDVDGSPYYQCVDLIQAYYQFLGVSPVSGNGADYTWNSLPSGWNRYKDAQPQKGDILVYTGGYNGYGHVAIYESDYVTYHQNFDYASYVTKVTYKYNGLTTPYWGVIRPSFSSPLPKGHVMSESEAAGRTIPDGDYWICSRIAQDYFVDLSGNSIITENGVNVHMWIIGGNLPGKYDVFRFKYLDNGFYQITQMGSNMAFDVSGGGLDCGANLQMYDINNTNAQQWSIEQTATGYKLRARCSSFCMDVAGGSYSGDANVQVWEDNSSNSQRFGFIPYAPDERPFADGVYTICSSISDTCFLDVSGKPGGFANNSNVQVYNSDDIWGHPDEKFRFEYAGNGYYRIYEHTSGLVLEVHNPASAEYLNAEQNVKLYSKNDTRGQFWKIRKNTDGTYCFINQLTGYCLDARSGSSENGNNVHAFSYNGTKAQKWKPIRVLQDDMVTVSDVEINSESEAVDPNAIVMVDGKKLTANTDYTVQVTTDIANGKGTVTVTGKGNYCDTVTKDFKITYIAPSILGDVDGDGDVSAIDATYVIRYSAQIDVQLDEADLMRGDVDGNEEIEIVDATYIQRYLAEFNIPYPIGEPI